MLKCRCVNQHLKADAYINYYKLYELLLYDLPFLSYALYITYSLPHSQSHLAKSCSNVVSYFMVHCGLSGWHINLIIEKTNYTNCVLIFSTDESNQLLCIASSDVLFTGQLKIDVEKPLLENNSHLFNDSTIQEIEQKQPTTMGENKSDSSGGGNQEELLELDRTRIEESNRLCHYKANPHIESSRSKKEKRKTDEHITPRNGDGHEKIEEEMDKTRKEGRGQKINIDLRTLAIDSIDSIIKSINQLDLNVYLIHLFFHNNDPNHLTLIEFHKLNNDQRFSKYEKYLLSNYITDFLMVIMPQISDNEIAQLIDHKIHSLTQIHPNFNEIYFLSRSVNERDSTVATMIMFNNLGFIKQWNICQSKLACFILTIKNNYRQPTYHNWTHAFTVGHMAYIILTIERTLIHQYLDEMEQLALFIGALCHDIDHRGFNNHYQTLIHSPLDAVYGYKGSILEHHHIDQTMRILNMKDCNIFSQMTKIKNYVIQYLYYYYHHHHHHLIEKAFIPELHIHFIDSIVLSCFKILSNILPKFQSILYTIDKNKQIWQILF
ncbi:unnamed protein product [Schistosoma margrebowiei]|uniref:Phosphodiesterase n=1 Tax=Schistosoma margrebowiei TaxID=48269 RepID=A0A183MHF4_9TREM|nr:unnamed protein product [Schistosoma margrebowiei]